MHKLYLGNCLDVMKENLESNSVDTCITDPPYGINFMGKEWDRDVPSPEYWKEVYRVLKPGAFLLCFAGTRSWHWMAVSIERAGFELRDTIMWLYGQGFPKSYNISKGIDKKLGAELWDGWGTSLKPAWEPILVFMKPREGSFVNNAMEHGVSGLNIDDSRIPLAENEEGYTINTWDNGAKPFGDGAGNPFTGRKESKGRWPANIILDDVSSEMLDEQAGKLKSGFMSAGTKRANSDNDGKNTYGHWDSDLSRNDTYGDEGGASRFFYCAKASRKERNLGLEKLEKREVAYSEYRENYKDTKDFVTHYPDGSSRPVNPTKNGHPTVKPLELMKYLCVLTATPAGGIVLDPFMGSGTTGMACKQVSRDFIGIELDEEYFEIAKLRIESS